MGDVAIEVTRADREAFVAYERLSSIPIAPSYAGEVLRGAWDSDRRILALARHRIASETTLRSRVAVLEGALREAAGIKSLLPPGNVDAAYLEGWCDGQTYLSLNICLIIAAALTQEQQP